MERKKIINGEEYKVYGVGNTAYTTAVEVNAPPRINPLTGYNVRSGVQFSIHIKDDGTTYFKNHRFRNLDEDDERFAGMLQLAEDYVEEDITSYVFMVRDRALMELTRHQRKIKDWQTTYTYMQELIEEDTSHPNLSWWVTNQHHAANRLLAYHQEFSYRMEMLRRIERVLHLWCHHHSPEHKTPVKELITQAVGEASRRLPPKAGWHY